LHAGLAAALLRANRVADAIEHYEIALRAQPDWAKAHKEIAVALYVAAAARKRWPTTNADSSSSRRRNAFELRRRPGRRRSRE